MTDLNLPPVGPGLGLSALRGALWPAITAVWLGFEITEGPFRYKSEHPPVPLSEFEEALLVAAGIGITGIPLWDGSRPPAYRSGDGRTFGTTVHGRRTALFFTNDSGLYAIGPAGSWATKLREIETPAERENILGLYQQLESAWRPAPGYPTAFAAAVRPRHLGLEPAGHDAVYASLRCEPRLISLIRSLVDPE